MISWIVASHDERILKRNLLPTLPIYPEHEYIFIDKAQSITKAYAEGQERATHEIKIYVHHDVQLLDPLRLQLQLTNLYSSAQNVGIIGVIGSRSMIMPWWNGDLVGSVIDTRLGVLNYGNAGGACAVVDGLMMITKQHIEWDLDWPGWHGYDYDACAQMTAQGLQNYCLTDGHHLVIHNSDSPYNLHSIDGWHTAVQRFHSKWGHGGVNL